MEMFEGVSHEELALMSQMGNEKAEEHLIREYKGLVRGKANTYFITGAENQDVVQEGMIGLFKAIKSYKPGKDASFKTYADICVNRQIMDAIKAANRKKHSPLNTSLSLDKSEDEDNLGFENIIVKNQVENVDNDVMYRDFIKHIAKVEKESLSPLEVRVWEEYGKGKSHKDIAAMLDKNPKAIYNAMERIKSKIMKYFLDAQ